MMETSGFGWWRKVRSRGPVARSRGARRGMETADGARPGTLGEGHPPDPDGGGDPCAGCPYATIDRLFCRWPHRCLFHGDGVQAWLVGLSPEADALRWISPARLTLTVTHGEARVQCGGRLSLLRHGESLEILPEESATVGAEEEADVLFLMSFVDG